jgi:peptidoglycan/xylan/chitin deacetylase (PgdA/CDA1 family)
MPALALTFDDGPDPVWTPRLLDLLAEVGARATFFPIAPRAAAHPELIRRARDEGHVIGLHCEQHVRHSERGLEWLRSDTATALRRLSALGVEPTLWRAPWGDISASSVRVAIEHQLGLIGWTVDSHDWRGDSAAEMFDATHMSIEEGAIVLAHDGIGPGARREGAAETLRYVDLIATQASSQGLSLEALS